MLGRAAFMSTRSLVHTCIKPWALLPPILSPLQTAKQAVGLPPLTKAANEVTKAANEVAYSVRHCAHVRHDKAVFASQPADLSAATAACKRLPASRTASCDT